MADETKSIKVNEQENLSDHDLDELAGGGGDVVPMDTLSINFAKVEGGDKSLKTPDAKPSRATDDVWVDGKIITAESW